jgi:hypothetical protein
MAGMGSIEPAMEEREIQNEKKQFIKFSFQLEKQAAVVHICSQKTCNLLQY